MCQQAKDPLNVPVVENSRIWWPDYQQFQRCVTTAVQQFKSEETRSSWSLLLSRLWPRVNLLQKVTSAVVYNSKTFFESKLWQICKIYFVNCQVFPFFLLKISLHRVLDNMSSKKIAILNRVFNYQQCVSKCWTLKHPHSQLCPQQTLVFTRIQEFVATLDWNEVHAVNFSEVIVSSLNPRVSWLKVPKDTFAWIRSSHIVRISRSNQLGPI